MKYLASVSLIFLFCCVDLGDQKMIVKKVQQCEDKDYPVSFNITVYVENEQQFMDCNATFKVPLSNELKGMFHVNLALGEKLIPIMNTTERNACTTAHKYLGKFIYDIEREISLVPGLCPVPKGKYRVNHHLLDFDKVTIRGFPAGRLRGSIVLIDKNNTVLGCLSGELENV